MRCPGSGCRCRRRRRSGSYRAAAPLRAADAGDALCAGEGRARRLPLRRAAADRAMVGHGRPLAQAVRRHGPLAARRGLRRGARGLRRHPGAAGAEALGRDAAGWRRGGACSTSAAASGSRRCGSRRPPDRARRSRGSTRVRTSSPTRRRAPRRPGSPSTSGSATRRPALGRASFDAVRAERLLSTSPTGRRRCARSAGGQARGRARLHRARPSRRGHLPDRSAVRRALAHGPTPRGRELAAGALLGC